MGAGQAAVSSVGRGESRGSLRTESFASTPTPTAYRGSPGILDRPTSGPIPVQPQASAAGSSASQHYYSASMEQEVVSRWEPPLPLQAEEEEVDKSAVSMLSQRIGGPAGQETWLEPVEHAEAARFLEDAQALPPYKIPKNPADIYSKQTGPLMADDPKSIVYKTHKFQVASLPEPFDKAMVKLPQLEGMPKIGPLQHPNEPVWGDMNNRLQAILRKQDKRADRKRKRKLRSKLLRGRSQPAASKKADGRDIREYFDKTAALAPDEPGEFLGKVHEKWMTHRDRAEAGRFQVRPGMTSGPDKFLYSFGHQSPRAQRVVRPVYMPPPNASMEVM